jgi:hypothetical protein
MFSKKLSATIFSFETNLLEMDSPETLYPNFISLGVEALKIKVTDSL